jgi:4'-phosphopantetheinyl transferase
MELIAPGEAHLFLVRLDAARDERLLDEWRELLSPEERARGDRYLFPRNRHEHLVAHALKRQALSRFAPSVDPRDWRFVAGEHGKPSIVEPACRLRFNLSHTDGLVACLVALEAEVGVDVEQTARRSDTVGIADRFFAVPEVEALRALPESAQRARFFEYWTLKEAYIKARGMGLALPWAASGSPSRHRRRRPSASRRRSSMSRSAGASFRAGSTRASASPRASSGSPGPRRPVSSRPPCRNPSSTRGGTRIAFAFGSCVFCLPACGWWAARLPTRRS